MKQKLTLRFEQSHTRCSFCQRTEPSVELNGDLCTECAASRQHVESVGKVGICPVCLISSSLYRNGGASLDHAYCYQHAIIGGLRFVSKSNKVSPSILRAGR